MLFTNSCWGVLFRSPGRREVISIKDIRPGAKRHAMMVKMLLSEYNGTGPLGRCGIKIYGSTAWVGGMGLTLVRSVRFVHPMALLDCDVVQASLTRSWFCHVGAVLRQRMFPVSRHGSWLAPCYRPLHDPDSERSHNTSSVVGAAWHRYSTVTAEVRE